MIEAYFDGVTEPVNPGGFCAYGAVIFVDRKEIWREGKMIVMQEGNEKMTSNNLAEYSGFVRILEKLVELKLQDESIIIRGDSNLVIHQMFASWKIKNGYYVEKAMKAKELLKSFSSIIGQWIPREQNSIADEISKDVLRKAGVEFRIQPE